MWLEVITNAIGLLVFALLLGAGFAYVLSRSAAQGLLKPVLVGTGLRLVVMVGAHIASVAAGDGGTLVVDDVGFLAQGSGIAEPWIDGQFVSLNTYTTSISNGYPALVATVFVLAGPSVFAAKLVNVLLGSATILLSGLIGKRLFGELGKRRTAWAVALLPTIVWWPAEMIKETLVTFLVVAAILALLSPPRFRTVATFAVIIAALYYTRPTATAAVLVGALVAYGVTALRHRAELDWRVLRINAALGAGGAALLVVVLSGGDPLGPINILSSTARSMADLYRDGSPLQAGADFARVMFIPFPWNPGSPIGWDRALIPGVWVLIALLPTAALGVWRLRSRPELLLILVPMVTSFAIYALTAGGAYRQRSAFEPLLVLLVVAGADSWRSVATRGAGLIAIVAPLAAVHQRSPVTGLAVLAGAVAVFLVARRLPAAPEQVAEPGPVLLDQLQSVGVPRPSALGPGLRRLRRAAPPLKTRNRSTAAAGR